MKLTRFDAARREFLHLLAAVPLAAGFSEAADSSATATIAAADEPGQRLVVRGVIYGADGRTAASAVRMSVYHTDTDGYYSRPTSDPRRARLRAALVTGPDGRYELRTILPGHYPGTTIERHIHVHLTPPGMPEHWVDSFLFQRDPHLKERDVIASVAAGAFGHVMKMEADPAGVLVGTRNFRLDPAVAERNRLMNGWYHDDDDHH
jgi:protocatechuate 3,4-dioxygenase beta subunit